MSLQSRCSIFYKSMTRDRLPHFALPYANSHRRDNASTADPIPVSGPLHFPEQLHHLRR